MGWFNDTKELLRSREDVTKLPELYHDGAYEAAGQTAKLGARSLFAMAGGGFGMGALITAAAFLIAFPLVAGASSMANMLFFEEATGAFAADAAVPLGHALVGGLLAGGSALVSGFGLASLIAGGVAGGALKVMHENDKLKLEHAQEQAKLYEQMRGEEQAQELSTAPKQPAKQQETQRSAAPDNTTEKTPPQPPAFEVKSGGFLEQELARRGGNRSQNINITT